MHEIESGQAILLEINYDALNAISWKKGCYMGQELTARTYYRGLIKKRYLPFKYEGLPPKKLQSIMHFEFEIGKVQAIGKEYGLGLFNIEKVKPFIDDAELLVHKGITFHVTVPDYLKEKFYSTNAQE
jgi:folate-binding protein YgfZ